MEPSLFRARLAPSRGFTLVEMLVVLALITIVTTIALLGQSNFNRSLLLTDTSYSVALSIRQMQSLGFSSQKYGSVQNPGYGAHFSTSTPGSYILFADIDRTAGVPTNCPVGTSGTPDFKPGNCLYDSADGIDTTYTFEHGYTIQKFCGTDGTGTPRCSDTNYLTALDVAFLRSDTETVINGKNASGSWVALTDAKIYIQAPTGESRGICISRVGQISVASSTCP